MTIRLGDVVSASIPTIACESILVCIAYWFTRLTNAYSKKIENHIHAIALHYMYYNFVRIHSSLRCSPAMAAKVSKKLWSVEDIVALLD